MFLVVNHFHTHARTHTHTHTHIQILFRHLTGSWMHFWIHIFKSSKSNILCKRAVMILLEIFETDIGCQWFSWCWFFFYLVLCCSLFKFDVYCRFSYAGYWELVKSIVGTKFRRSHICLRSQAGNRLWQLMALFFFVVLW